ncbi:ferrochelatase [Haematobacter massiliensis]|uniref:Ferrochelatase n=1 Tax=Haematobacter massiliensis TaxID=195105 RepID=A0A086YAH0_9RHOB|nr:ferrochelatase [Haematobacter massiliensis]KFI31270.1 ferrochelatase [Haematobacter massiliensis]OWJ74158.1 ferrochelatase [Haematobacter massiliensis]OWJ87007.1 ferrochelatase [Haematobacter massiliensis]QBJ23341.1 ferrochelatase [Haematobacter massiliensis]
MLDQKPSSLAVRPSHAPPDHPALPPRRIGVLLANLGTPDGYDYWSMRRYLNEFLSDKRVIDYPAWKWQPLLQTVILTKRPFSSGANYKLIWDEERGESPLLTITRNQTEALRNALTGRFGDAVTVDFCMRYGNPATAEKVAEMVAAGCDRILFFPLYPQYAGATTATANDQFFRALMAEKWQPAARTVPAYFDHPLYVEALARSVEAAYAALPVKPQKLVTSYHGMPVRYHLSGDPYQCQCQKTTRLLRERLGWEKDAVDVTFQSVFGPEEWLKPYTVEHVAVLARQGIRNIAMMAPAFSADCIETLEEINGEIRHAFEEAGGETFTYIPCLNDEAAHIAALEAIVAENLAGWVA